MHTYLVSNELLQGQPCKKCLFRVIILKLLILFQLVFSFSSISDADNSLDMEDVEGDISVSNCDTDAGRSTNLIKFLCHV